MAEPIISVSGLRGVIGDSLTPELVVRFVAAYLADLPAGPIVVGRDGRASGPMLAQAARATIMASGRDAIYADVAATPTIGVLVKSLGAAGGIQISASHNPSEYNGLKLFDGGGRVLPANVGEAVLERYRSGATAWVSHKRLGTADEPADTTTTHLELVARTVDVERIREQRYRVLLDANHGSGAVLGVPLLEHLGCEVTCLGGEPHGQFAHTPEPTAENLAGVLASVQDCGAQVGFCQDPDADRLAVIDEQGRYLGEEYTLAICLDHLLRQTPGPVVTNCATSRMSQDLAEKYGVPFYRAAVGEANVVDAMLANDAVLGGEGNGGSIHPQVGLVRDSFVGMAMVLDAMAARELPVSALADELPSYAICKTKITLPPDKVAAGLDAIEQHFSEAEADRLDGLRLDWPGRWLLVRASNTEPIVRAIAEADSEDTAQQMCDAAAEVLAKV